MRELRRHGARSLGATAFTGASQIIQEVIGWMVATGDADSHGHEAETLRARSYDLHRNAPLVTGAVNNMRTNVVGGGLRLQSRIDHRALGLDEGKAAEIEEHIERWWRWWAEDPREFDVEQTKTIYDLQDMMAVTEMLAGEAVAAMPRIPRRGSGLMSRVQLIHPARLSQPAGVPQTSRLALGVERDGNGAVVAYHFREAHPGTSKIDKLTHTWRRFPRYGNQTLRQQVFHLYRSDEPDQSRGFPELAPIIQKLKQLDRYTDAEVMAAVVGGFLAVVFEDETGFTVDPDDELAAKADAAGVDSENSLALGYGSIIQGPPGMKANTIAPNRPNTAFDPFTTAVFRQIGPALGQPLEVLTQHFQSSYSAARAALLSAWKGWMTRRQRIVRQVCQPIYVGFLWEMVASGRIDLPGFTTDPFVRSAWSRAAWIGPPRGMIDPQREVMADIILNNAAIKPRSDIAQELTGNDWDESITRIARELSLIHI